MKCLLPWQFRYLLLVPVLLMAQELAVAGETRLPPEVFQGWQDYLQEVAHVRGNVDSYRFKCDKNWNEIQLSSKFSGRILWVGMSVRRETDGTVGDRPTVHTAGVQNRDYGADIARNAADNDQWHIKKMQSAASEQIEPGITESGKPLVHALMNVAIGVNLHPTFFPEFFAKPTVKILKLEEDTIDGKRAVWVHFRDELPKSEKGVRRSGKIALLPEYYWIARKAELIEDHRWKTGQSYAIGTIDFKYSDPGNSRVLLPTSYENKTREFDKPNGLLLNYWLHKKTFDLEFVNPESIDESEFRLSYYDLPEPFPVKRSRWWIVLMTIGTGLIGAWWFVSVKDRKVANHA